MPPENASLHGLVYNGSSYDYNGGEVEIGSKLEYHCFNGQKGAQDFGFTFQEAGCDPENQWTPPAVWENCTTSIKEEDFAATMLHCSNTFKLIKTIDILKSIISSFFFEHCAL